MGINSADDFRAHEVPTDEELANLESNRLGWIMCIIGPDGRCHSRDEHAAHERSKRLGCRLNSGNDYFLRHTDRLGAKTGPEALKVH